MRRSQLRFLADGDTVDLGDRQFKVIHTRAHSPDGLALYDEAQQLFFGGDTFLGAQYLIIDMAQLADDLQRISRLTVAWHYSSHGVQLIETMQEGRHLAVVRRMLAGDGEVVTTQFAGMEFPMHRLDGVDVTVASDFLTY